MKLLCETPHFYDDFILCRDRGASFLQDCSHQAHGSFLISSVSLAEGGTYRCLCLREYMAPSGPCPATLLTFPSQVSKVYN